MNFHFTRNNQIGDTIVEVLIATVVASSVLVGAFSIASKSSEQIRASQERAEALKYASSAVEAIRGLSSKAIKLTQGEAYCADLSTLAHNTGNPSTPFGGPVSELKDDKNSDFNPDPACKSTGSVVEYNTTVTYDNPTDGFTVRTRWDRVNGGDRQEVKLNYRLDK